MLGSPCSPCCGECTETKREDLWNRICAANVTVNLSGTFPRQDVASQYTNQLLHYNTCRSKSGTPDGSTLTLAKHDLEFLPNLVVYEESDDLIGSVQLALSAANVPVNSLSSYVAGFVYTGQTKTISLSIALPLFDDPVFPAREWPGSRCLFKIYLNVMDTPYGRQIPSPLDHVSFHYDGPQVVNSFVGQAEVTGGYLESEYSNGFWASDVAPGVGPTHEAPLDGNLVFSRGFIPEEQEMFQISEDAGAIVFSADEVVGSRETNKWRSPIQQSLPNVWGGTVRKNYSYSFSDVTLLCNSWTPSGDSVDAQYRPENDAFSLTPTIYVDLPE